MYDLDKSKFIASGKDYTLTSQKVYGYNGGPIESAKEVKVIGFVDLDSDGKKDSVAYQVGYDRAVGILTNLEPSEIPNLDNYEGYDSNLSLETGRLRFEEVTLLKGGRGVDKLVGAGLDDKIIGRGGNDKIWGHGFDDTLKGGAGNDKIWGGSGYDKLFGGGGRDRLDGGDDNDVIYGQKGADKIFGGHGHDIINGGAGRDKIYAGTGSDELTGGRGADKFIFDIRDGYNNEITDFELGVDKIVFSKGMGALEDIYLSGVFEAEVRIGDVEITLTGIQRNDLTADDFIFL